MLDENKNTKPDEDEESIKENTELIIKKHLDPLGESYIEIDPKGPMLDPSRSIRGRYEDV